MISRVGKKEPTKEKHFTSYSTESQKKKRIENAIEYSNITARLDKRSTYLIASMAKFIKIFD